eukprot:Gregarina_sp_Poly_1__7624@NODE_4286_length_661_cov_6_008418_g2840_i0_p1_GENE_NODE_4286_length_661_cov_6_008418_g2840_i0NODE_4286_length_661_cov_6_008418_g2840_i0_p1_ORF_typecomplete_len102_score9_80DUF4118/PF13493_6/0_073CENPW/PF15510_6/0_23_NODE_4286_length_661_cov_6_008418_g2840_i0355660
MTWLRIVHHHAPLSCVIRDKTDSFLHLAFAVFLSSLQNLRRVPSIAASCHFCGTFNYLRTDPHAHALSKNTSAASPALVFDFFMVSCFHATKYITHKLFFT